MPQLEYSRGNFSALSGQLRRLWRDSFGDGDSYINAFFGNFNVERSLHTLSVGGELVSALYALPCGILSAGVEKRAAYIYAVATDARHRGRGYMSCLMDNVHNYLRANGFSAALLLPGEESLFGYYARMGYEICSHRTVVELLPAPSAGGYELIRAESLSDDIFEFADSMMHRRIDNVILPREWLSMNVCNCRLSGGALYVARGADGVYGAAFTALQNNRPLLLDILCEEPSAADFLVNTIAREYSVESLPLLRSSADGRPQGMMLRFDNSLPPSVNMQLMLDI